ncbi:MAG: hypothetical protein KC461_13055 [Dehalococcoidia bacterium]|nr:hypothetical protein [Dehalococcoidia bacterium]
MSERQELRDEYLSTVCSALSDYLRAGKPLSIHSKNDGERLHLTFVLDAPDTFHAMVEGRAPRAAS